MSRGEAHTLASKYENSEYNNRLDIIYAQQIEALSRESVVSDYNTLGHHDKDDFLLGSSSQEDDQIPAAKPSKPINNSKNSSKFTHTYTMSPTMSYTKIITLHL
jgi:hypothetical protein